MNAMIPIAIMGLVVLLAVSTLLQTLYLETLRLRTRELPSLTFFKGTLEERLGVKTEEGATAFSLLKHTCIVLIGALFLGMIARNSRLTPMVFLQAAFSAWFIVIFAAYVVPETLYRRTSARWLAPLTPVLRGTVIVMRPLNAVLNFFQSLAQLGEPESGRAEEATPQENIDALISAGTEEGIIEEEDRKLIQSAAVFGSKTVREVMTARPNIVAIPASSSLEDLRQLAIHEQFSRIPVYEDTVDQITGFVHVRDMFELDEEQRGVRSVRELARPVRLVPETKPVTDLLREMQQAGAHLAVVVDEYGNTAGLVTMEDMVEELVGEIRDEHEPAHDVQPDNEGGFVLSGSFDVDHLGDLLGFRPHNGTESTTIGGLVTEWMGRVPRTGEAVERNGIRIQVLAGNELRVEQVRVSRSETNGHA